MFEDLFEYQKSDFELLKLENEIKSTPEYKAYKADVVQFKEAKKQVERLEVEAAGVQAGQKRLEEISSEIDKLTASLGEITSIIENVEEIEDLSELDYYQERMQKIFDEMLSYEKEIKAVDAKITEINKRYAEAVKSYKESAKSGKLSTVAFKAVQEKYAVKEKEIKDRVKGVYEEMKDKYPDIMNVYDRLKGEKKLPAVVEYNNGFCGGCGMEVSQGTVAKLKSSGDFAECQHCYRMMVVK